MESEDVDRVHVTLALILTVRATSDDIRVGQRRMMACAALLATQGRNLNYDPNLNQVRAIIASGGTPVDYAFTDGHRLITRPHAQSSYSIMRPHT